MTKSKTNCVEEPQTAPQHDAQEVQTNAARFGQFAAAAYTGASAVLAILMVATDLGPAIAFIIPAAAGAFAVAAYLARPRDCAAALITAVGSSVVMAAYAVAALSADSPSEGALYAAAAMLAAFPHLLAVLAYMDCPDVV
jgi:hypothetical protein